MAPPAFTELEFEEALERSRETQSILIVDAMAAWCAPCRQMDATTWTDPEVVGRLTGDGAFAIQLDVDDAADVAIELAIRAMPTLIAFVNGVEHDRVVGGRSPKQLLEWLDIVERGERFEDAQRAQRAHAAEQLARADRRIPELLDVLPDLVLLAHGGLKQRIARRVRHIARLGHLLLLRCRCRPLSGCLVAPWQGC